MIDEIKPEALRKKIIDTDDKIDLPLGFYAVKNRT